MIPEFETQLALARRYLQTRSLPGRAIFCALTGAHLYGFPSPDSDLDLKGAYIVPTEELLGLSPDLAAFDITEDHEGVECDLTLLELAKALTLLLGGNGNTLEQLTSPYQVLPGNEQRELRALAEGAISRRFGRHYRGFLRGLRRDFEREERPEVKTLLYGYRVTCTGLHLLGQGEIQANVQVLAPDYGFSDVADLIARKGGAEEHTRLTAQEKDQQVAIWDELDARLAEAYEKSRLPEEPTNHAAINSWLVSKRREGICAPTPRCQTSLGECL